MNCIFLYVHRIDRDRSQREIKDCGSQVGGQFGGLDSSTFLRAEAAMNEEASGLLCEGLVVCVIFFEIIVSL